MKKLESITNWKIIIGLAVIFLTFNAYLLPTNAAKMSDIAGYDVTVPDLRLTYSINDILKFFEDIGKEGRATYQYIAERLDVIYPIVYGILFCLLLLKLTNSLSNSKWQFVSLVPLAAMIFDFIENFGFLKMLHTYPSITESQVSFNSSMTSLKWVFIFLSILLIIILVILKLIKIKIKKM